MDNLLGTVIWNGKTLGDLLTLDMLASLAGSIFGALAIVVLGFFIAGLVRGRLVRMGQKYRRLDQTLFTFLGNLSRYAILAYTAIFVLNTFGVQTTSVVALIGAAGLAVGLALQGTLANVAAGVMIILFRPIKLGDFVEVAGQSGTVKDITLNNIELATLANVQVIVPNGKVWGDVITNYSVYQQRRAEWVFGVSYSSDLKLVEHTIREVIEADPRALAEPAPFVQVNNLGDYSVDFLVRYWCTSSDYWQFQADIKRKVKEAFDAKGIDIPFPTQTHLTVPA
ncbi:MAG: mechanosensitive ion channel [Limimaricola sp.]|uniref:mechanosensitive ion channel family protein n=1 Tax=Limimaricola sp. TaxID=2211665 RepID=UPI001D558D89|nr:mechanosensitive ion channel domain-containing protein [Limimaricola sp.]MBI1418728.1 mechanosensitive ion channel [Limimaricola sp.]